MGSYGINMNKVNVKNYSPREMAEFCNTTESEILNLLKEGVFREFQHNPRQPKDVIGDINDIISVYNQWKQKSKK